MLLIPSPLLAQEKIPFRIVCEVASLRSPAKVILTVRDVSQWVEYTAESQTGKFILTGTLYDPSFAFLVLKYGNESDQSPRMASVLELFIDTTPVSIKAKDSLKFATVLSGSTQKDFETYQKMLPVIKKKSNDERMSSVRQFIEEHANSFVSLHAIQNFSMDGNFALDPKHAPSLFTLLSPKIRMTPSGVELKKGIEIAQHTAIGAIAPDFSQLDTLDRAVQLNSFRGNFVLIDFWASWCKPCRIENPMLVEVYKKYGSKNFTVLGVSLDNNKNSWLKAIRKDGLTWTHVSDLKFWKNEVALLYGVKAVPQNFLIDPEGKIINRNLKPKDLELQLKKLLR